ncbi:NUDIX domain-containing protein [Candidatus Dojkabacteria bacterium]|nr:NUDIX domain-containing protein [Candidatus Dojkabacteria bacterium]
MNRFQNVIFGQKAFIVKGDKLLIVKRKDVDILSGIWDVPGGKLENTDSLSEGLAREVNEETGLNLVRIRLIISTSKFVGRVGDHPTIFRNIYLCTAEGKVQLSKEHSEFKWIKLDKIDQYRFPDEDDFQASLKKLPEIVNAMTTKTDVILSEIF